MMDGLLVFSVLLVTLVIYWLFLLRYTFTWKGVPFLMPIPFFGTMKIIDFIFMDPLELELKYYKKYGRLYGFLSGNALSLALGEPELIRLVTNKDSHIFLNRRNFGVNDEITEKMLFVAEGNVWKRIRSAVTPTFSSGKMKQMIFLINECAESLLQNIQDHVKEKKKLDVKPVVGAFTMDVICSTAFSSRVDSHKDPNNPIITNARKIFSNEAIRFAIPLAVAFPSVLKFFAKFKIFSTFDTSFFKEVTQEVLEKRRKLREAGKETRIDFLNLMIDAQENFEKERRRSFPKEEVKNGTEEFTIINKLDEIEIIAQCVQFFTVGFDTTATTISLALHLLSSKPKYQDMLYAEIEEQLSKNEGQVNYELLKKMPFLEAVVCETLRLYPAATVIDREASEDYDLGDTGLIIPKGTDVLIPVAAIHRDPEFFPNPDEFVPERFLPENRDSINPYAYLPFGAGPRICIANRFAQMEAKTALIHLIHKFRFFYPEGANTEIQFKKGQFLVQPHNYYLSVEERSPKKTI